jgi:CDP-diacylglycerol--serine O-phosphatidyltransferase
LRPASETRIVKKKIAIVPTLCTLGNGCCGFAAVYFAAHFETERMMDLRSVVYISGWLILAAMVFDALDGYLARLSKTASEFGVQLDSLCDVISFGVAPAFLLIRLGWEADFHRNPAVWDVILVVAAVYMACTILRLARFNVQTNTDAKSHRSFQGLPSPAAAGCIASLIIVSYDLHNRWLASDRWLSLEYINPIIHVLAPLGALTVAILMVSSVPYPHVASQLLHRRRSYRRLVQLIPVLVIVVLLRELAFLMLFWLYALAGPARVVWNQVLHRRTLPDPGSGSEPSSHVHRPD